MDKERFQKFHAYLVENDYEDRPFEEFAAVFEGNPSTQRELFDFATNEGIIDKSWEEFQSRFFTTSEKKSPDVTSQEPSQPSEMVSEDTETIQERPEYTPTGDFFKDVIGQAKAGEVQALTFDEKLARSRGKAMEDPARAARDWMRVSVPAFTEEERFASQNIPDATLNKIVTKYADADMPDWQKSLEGQKELLEATRSVLPQTMQKRLRDKIGADEEGVAHANPVEYHRYMEGQMNDTHAEAGMDEREGVLKRLRLVNRDFIPEADQEQAQAVLAGEYYQDLANKEQDVERRNEYERLASSNIQKAQALREQKADAIREHISNLQSELIGEQNQERRQELLTNIRSAEQSLKGFQNPEYEVANLYVQNKDEVDRQPGKTFREKMENYLATLHYLMQQYSKNEPGDFLSQVLSMTTAGETPWQRMAQDAGRKIQAIAPAVILNESAKWMDEETTSEAFSRALHDALIPGSAGPRTGITPDRQTMGMALNEMLQIAGVPTDALSPGEIEEVKRKQESYELKDPRFISQTAGTSLGLMGDIMVGSGVLKASKLGKAAFNLLKGAKRGKKILPVLASAVESGAAYELSGQIFQNNREELNFATGLMGGFGQQAGSGMIKAAAKKLGRWFGDKTPEAINAIAAYGASKAGAGSGEMIEETAQEITQMFRESKTGEEFWARFDNLFGDSKERTKFLVSSFLMGSVMSAGHNGSLGEDLINYYNAQKEQLPADERAEVEAIEEELVDESIELQEEVAGEQTEESVVGEEVGVIEEIAPKVEAAPAEVSGTVETEEITEQVPPETAPEAAEAQEIVEEVAPEAPLETEEAQESVLAEEQEITGEPETAPAGEFEGLSDEDLGRMSLEDIGMDRNGLKIPKTEKNKSKLQPPAKPVERDTKPVEKKREPIENPETKTVEETVMTEEELISPAPEQNLDEIPEGTQVTVQYSWGPVAFTKDAKGWSFTETTGKKAYATQGDLKKIQESLGSAQQVGKRTFDQKGRLLPGNNEEFFRARGKVKGNLKYKDGKWHQVVDGREAVIPADQQANVQKAWYKSLSPDEKMADAARRMKKSIDDAGKSLGSMGGESLSNFIEAATDYVVAMGEKGIRNVETRLKILRNTYGEDIDPYLDSIRSSYEERMKEEEAEDVGEPATEPEEKKQPKKKEKPESKSGETKQRGTQTDTLADSEVSEYVAQVVAENPEYYKVESHKEVIDIASQRVAESGGFDKRYAFLSNPVSEKRTLGSKALGSAGDAIMGTTFNDMVYIQAERLLALGYYSEKMVEARNSGDTQAEADAYNKINGIQRALSIDATIGGRITSILSHWSAMNPEAVPMMINKMIDEWNTNLRERQKEKTDQVEDSRKRLKEDTADAASETADSGIVEDFIQDENPTGNNKKSKKKTEKTKSQKRQQQIKKIQKTRKDAIQRLKDASGKQGGFTTGGLNQDAIEAIQIIATSYVKEGYVRFADWAEQMILALREAGVDEDLVDLKEFWDEDLAATTDAEITALQEAQKRSQRVRKVVTDYYAGGREGSLQEALESAGMPTESASEFAKMVEEEYESVLKEKKKQAQARKEARDMVPPPERDLANRVKDAINQHYTDPGDTTLEEKFLEAGLSQDQATDLAEAVRNQMEDRLRDSVIREAKKVAGRDAGVLTKRPSEKLKEDLKRRKERAEQPRKKRDSATDKLMDTVLDGNFSDTAFMDAFSETFGFIQNLTPEQYVDLQKKAEAVRKAPQDSVLQREAVLELSKAASSLIPRTKWQNFFDQFLGWFYSNMLMGYTTHAKNLLSVMGNIAGRPLMDALNVSKWIRATRQIGQGDVKGFFDLMPINPVWWGAWPLLKGGTATTAAWTQFWDTMKTGDMDPKYIESILKGKYDQVPALERAKGKWNPARVLRYAGRSLAAEDRFMFTILYERELMLAIRQHYFEQGLRGKELRKAVFETYSGNNELLTDAAIQANNEIAQMEEIAGKMPPQKRNRKFKIRMREIVRENMPLKDEAVEQAGIIASDNVFTHTRHGIFSRAAGMIGQFANQNEITALLAKPWFPFTRIVGNMGDYMMDFVPIYGLVRAQGWSPTGLAKFMSEKFGREAGSAQMGSRKQKDNLYYEQMGRAWFGSLATGILFMLLNGADDDDFMSVGGAKGPDAYKLKINGKPVLDYRLFPALAPVLVGIGEWNRRDRDYSDESLAERFGLSLLATGVIVKDLGIMKGFQDFVNMMSDSFDLASGAGDGKARVNAEMLTARLIKQYGGFISRPLPTNNRLLQQIAQLYNTEKNSTNDIKSALFYLTGLLPYGVDGAPKSVDIFGNIRKGYPGQDIVPLQELLDPNKEAVKMTRFLVEHNAFPEKLKNMRLYFKSNGDIPYDYRPLDGWEYSEYAKLTGKKFSKYLKEYMNGNQWRKDAEAGYYSGGKWKTDFQDRISKMRSQSAREAKYELFGDKAEMSQSAVKYQSRKYYKK